MRLVTRDELLKEPKGAVFYEFFPEDPDSIALMRFDGEYNGDFLESTIGPYYRQAGSSKEMWRPHVAINSDSGREGGFAVNALYVVLDSHDIESMILQLRGQDPQPQYLPLP